MALTAESLANRIREKYKASDAIPYVEGDATAEAAIEAMAEAVVEEITKNAVVASGISVTVDPNTGKGATDGTGTIE